MTTDNTTHFGFTQVNEKEKVNLVRGVFDSVASQYDIMNDFMSLGIHRIWKRVAVQLSNAREGDHVLDLAGGTGDLTTLFSKRVGKSGKIVLADINSEMLRTGRDRLIDRGITKNISFAQVNAECLPFEDNTFDCVCIAFGLRNVTDKDAALRSMMRILKPGGRVIVLEFSHPTNKITEKVYDFYSVSLKGVMVIAITFPTSGFRNRLTSSSKLIYLFSAVSKALITRGFMVINFISLG
jgi:demethylmenaquinone methyltransferase/2-methoxy-6-polyprenyl-1,4-benzoquinol methylase